MRRAKRVGHSRLWRRLQGIVGRGTGQLVDDIGVLQRVQVQLSPLEIRDNTLRLGEFGLASNPPPGFTAALVFMAGDRSNGVIVGTEHPIYRLRNLPIGASALYDSLGQYIALLPLGIYVACPAGMVLTGPITATVVSDATGSLAALRAEVEALKAAYNLHTHSALNTSTPPVGPGSGTPSIPV